jgi:hypothetical protein
MKDFNRFPVEHKDYILTWMFVLLLRTLGLNIYNDESKAWSIMECKSKEDIDAYFIQIMDKYKIDNRESARGLKRLVKGIEIKSR